MRIVSFNVNGLRAAARKGFAEWLATSGADIVGLQEVRAHADQVPPTSARPEGWHVHWSAAQRPGYSGVALFSRQAPERVRTTLGDDEMDGEGRVQIAEFGALVLANVYFPNGSGTNRDNSRIPFKLAFYQRLEAVLRTYVDAGRPVLVMGDWNTAHREIDLARPSQNRQTSGFCDEEREELDRWIRAGWTDTFRAFEPGPEHYTWWSQRAGIREKNIGWRIDLVLASPAAMRHVRGASIHPDILLSDHCPISVDVDPGIVTSRDAVA